MELRKEDMVVVNNSEVFEDLLVNNDVLINIYFIGLKIEQEDYTRFIIHRFENCVFEHCIFSCTNMYKIVFSSVIFDECYFNHMQMRYSALRSVKFKETILNNVNFESATLHDVAFPNSSLVNLNFYNATINDVYCSNAKVVAGVHYLNMQCPEEGSFIGFKRACIAMTGEEVIVKLLIPADAKRSSATTRKCRCSKAEVLAIYAVYDKSIRHSEARSKHDWDFTYKIGETVAVDNFDENRWHECASGIHFFITEQEAINY